MRLREFGNDNVTTWKTIAARNNLANPNLILPGQVLDVGDDIVLPRGTTYQVKSGDTLSGIAKKIRQGWNPGADSSTRAEPDMPVASSTQANTSAPNPKKDPGGIAKRSTTKQVTTNNTTANPSNPGYHDPVYDAPPDTKSAPAVRTGGVATAQDLEASKQDLKKYQADQKQRMADREKNYEKDVAAAEKAKKETEQRRKQKTDPQVDPKGIPKKNAPTSDQLKSIQKSVYGQESGSGTADTSKPNYAGAIGPMQILPKTFEWLKQLGKIPKDYDINNPEHNKAGGDALLGHYHDKYKGDPKKVSAAYYGGPGAVNKDGSINTHWRDKKNPKAPTVGQYIQQVLGRMEK
jgi:soluble lytic murein transglycosylase-like protein